MPTPEEWFDRLPLYVKEVLTCKHDPSDPNVEQRSYSSLFDVGSDGLFVNPRQAASAPLGFYCLTCEKPTKFTVRDAVQICEECDKYYVPRFDQSEYPVRWRICRDCGG